jgi:LysR family transcriptional activator of mexEF-oprN operon
MQTIRSIENAHERVGLKKSRPAGKLLEVVSLKAQVTEQASIKVAVDAIDHFNLRNFDLNLMLVFDALMRERSVTRAATLLRVQQPTMSHNLSTLRLLLQDELFVRVGQIMQPTAKALALADGVNQVLSQAHQLLLTSQPFNPTQEERTFRIGFSSELEVILMPPLAAHLHSHAPGIRVHARASSPEDVFHMLDDHMVDFAVGCYGENTSRYRRKELFQQSLTCCYNPKLLKVSKDLTREQYLSKKHALVSQRQEIEGCLDDALKRLGVKLDVAMAAPEFLTILTAVAEGPFIATLPTRIVNRYARLFGLAICAVPIELAVAPIAMVWAAHADREPAFAWIREQVCPVIMSASQIS